MVRKLWIKVGVAGLVGVGLLMVLHKPISQHYQDYQSGLRWKSLGQVYDSKGRALTALGHEYALSINLRKLQRLSTADRKALMNLLAAAMNSSAITIENRLPNKDRVEFRVAVLSQLQFDFFEKKFKQLSLQQRAAIRIDKSWAYTYPFGKALSNVVGIADRDGFGQEAVMLSSGYDLAHGKNVSLTIDAELQRELFRLLQEKYASLALNRYEAVLLDLKERKVRAVVDSNSVDPDQRQHLPMRVVTRTVSDRHELGPMLYPLVLQGLIANDPSNANATAVAFSKMDGRFGERMMARYSASKFLHTVRSAGLDQQTLLGMPGQVQSRVRGRPDDQEEMHDVAAGYGVASSWMAYSLNLASRINGDALHPWSLIEGQVLKEGLIEESARTQNLLAQMMRQSVADLVPRDDGASTIPMNFGAYWTQYNEKTPCYRRPCKSGDIDFTTPRTSVAVFFPAEKPRYLLTIFMRHSETMVWYTAKDAMVDGGMILQHLHLTSNFH